MKAARSITLTARLLTGAMLAERGARRRRLAPPRLDAMTKLDISDDLGTKPEVPKPTGEPPAELVTDDVVIGEGTAAKPGDHVTVHYVGVSFSTGKQFDSSWDRRQPFDFPLGGGAVIQGWDFGVTGMREGGRRTLIIPPALAYGARGVGPIGPNETLVFIVDLVNVG